MSKTTPQNRLNELIQNFVHTAQGTLLTQDRDSNFPGSNTIQPNEDTHDA